MVKSLSLFPDTSKKSQKEGEKNEIVLAPVTVLALDAETVKPSKADSKGTIKRRWYVHPF